MKRKRDYLKYWRVIRYYYMRRYNIKTVDLDMILYLYSEGYFTKAQFQKFNNVLVWDRNRMKRLMDDGFIEIFRPQYKDRKATYQLTYKAKRMVSGLYDKLEGGQFSMSPDNNIMYKSNARFSDKVIRNMIKEMNRQVLDNDMNFFNDIDL